MPGISQAPGVGDPVAKDRSAASGVEAGTFQAVFPLLLTCQSFPCSLRKPQATCSLLGQQQSGVGAAERPGPGEAQQQWRGPCSGPLSSGRERATVAGLRLRCSFC